MALGYLVTCIEEMEIVNFGVIFREGQKYLLVPEENGKYYIVDEKHNPILILQKEFKRHFKI